MRAVGVDFGTKRIGVAISDSGGTVATPFETVKRVGDRTVEHGRIIEIAAEISASAIVVGLPYSLDGERGNAARTVESEIRGLRKRLRTAHPDIEVHTQDERFSTVTAEQAMQASGIRQGRRRDVVDQIAAAVLLQSWLDALR